MAFEHARALRGMSAALAAESRHKEAEQALSLAGERFELAGNQAQLAGLRLDQAALLERRGEREAATAMAEDALGLAEAGGFDVEIILTRLLLSDLALPDLERAEVHLTEASKRSEGIGLPHLRYRIDWRRGRIQRLAGNPSEALRLLEDAIERIEQDRLELSRESLRRSFLRDKTEAYENLLELHLAEGGEANLRRAFEVAERAKSRALVDLLIGNVDERMPSVDDPELLVRLRELRADLNAIYNTMLGGSRDGERAVALDMLQQRAVELEREISSLQARGRGPLRDEPLVDPDAMADFQAQLAPGEILLAYHVVNDEVIAFLSDRSQMRVVRDVCRASAILAHLWRLSAQFDRFQVGAGFTARHGSQLEASASRVLAALYDALLRPIAPALKEMSHVEEGVPALTIVPHGALHQVPFHALFDGERYLIDDYEIAYAPSTTVKFLCQARTPRHMGASLVMAVDDPRIPAALQEAESVASWLEGATVLVGAEARCDELASRAGACDVVHLACHGMFRADNPMYSSLQLHDGWLTADDILGLRLDGALVTLSACESGRGQVIGGDEVLGLSRAFLGAGAASLAVSLWLVQDDTTATLMTDWYHGLYDGMEPAAALREAQLRLKADYPHPYYWAPFILLGRR
jgi:CHAT domain-containing protein